MLKEAIILAGGVGSRLKSVVADIPKPMAKIVDLPFLSYLLKQCQNNHIDHVVLSVGYKFEIIQSFYGNSFKNVEITYAVEKERLGTGGGFQNALHYIKNKNSEILLLNGDSILDLNLENFYQFHTERKAKTSIALKEMNDFDRYGTVEIKEHLVQSFHEKKPTKAGLINSGIYLINAANYLSLNLPSKHSFEIDFLSQNHWPLYGYVSNGFFIDIGVPEDYYRAQELLPKFFNAM